MGKNEMPVACDEGVDDYQQGHMANREQQEALDATKIVRRTDPTCAEITRTCNDCPVSSQVAEYRKKIGLSINGIERDHFPSHYNAQIAQIAKQTGEKIPKEIIPAFIAYTQNR